MGDDVQYYGGYNPQLERQIRRGFRLVRDATLLRYRQPRPGRESHSTNANGRKTSDLPTIPSTVAMSTMYASTIVSSPRARPIIRLANCTPHRCDGSNKTSRSPPKNKKVILCYHIPFTFGNAPYRKAKPVGIESEKGHFTSSRLSSLLTLLESFEGGYQLFCGHTHFACNHEIDMRDAMSWSIAMLPPAETSGSRT